MAQPTPIIVTASTPFVQVNTLQSSYTPVILSSIGYTGQTVSIQDKTGLQTILDTPIVISTGNTLEFSNGSISTLIQQPTGFVTLQSQLPNKWNFLNSYPFRDQYISAGILNITASTVTSFAISSLLQNTNLLYVENLNIISSFNLDSDITIITNVIARGNVVLNSSLQVSDKAFFSSQLYVKGPVEFFSSITVNNKLNISSSIETRSSVYVSSGLFLLGNISTPTINLFGGLGAPYIEIQQSTMDSLDVAGSVSVGNSISTLSSLIVGSTYNTNTIDALSSVLYSSFAVGNGISTYTSSIFNTLSTLNIFALKNDLIVGNELIIKDNLYGENNLYIGNELEISTNLHTYTISLENLAITGTFSSFSSIVSTSVLSTLKDIYTKDATLSSLYVQDSISSILNLRVGSNFTVNGNSFIAGSISSYNGGEIYGNLSINSNGLIRGNVNASTSINFNNSLSINGTFSTNTSLVYPYSTIIEDNVSIEGSLYVKGTAYISTVNLASFLETKQVNVDTYDVGYIAIVSSQNVSSLITSSIVSGGGASNTDYGFTLYGSLSTPNISTNYIIAESIYINKNNSSNSSNSLFQIASSFSVHADNTLNSNIFYINTDGYLLSSATVYETLSTNNVIANEMIGTHVGDGFFLSNIPFPAKLSSLLVSSTRTRAIEYYASSFYASSFFVDSYMFANSTIKVGDINLFGNASINFSTTNINAIYSYNANALYINNLLSYYDSVNKKAYINVENPNFNSPYTLEVNGITSVSTISSPNFTFTLTTLNGRNIVVSSFNQQTAGNIVVSTGVLSFGSTTQLSLSTFSSFPFIYTFNQNPALLPRTISANTIVSPTGVLSSLVFNNIFYVNRAVRRVGVGSAISAPTFTLDVQSTIYCDDGMMFSNINISDRITVNQQTSSFFIGGSSTITGVSSNISYSSDGENWSNYQNINGMPLVNSIGYNGKLWVITGSATSSNFSIQYSSNLPTWQTATGTLFTPNYPGRSIGWNGSLWIIVGASAVSPNRTIVWSSNASNWNPIDFGGFNSQLSTSGGYGIGWNGNIWVAGGIGNTDLNSLQYSEDGLTWLNAQGGFDTFDLVWAERVWVAVGRSSILGGIQIKTSEDGRRWSTSLLQASGGPANSVAYGNGTIVVVRSNTTPNTILYSLDFGNSWSNASGTLFSAQGNSIAWNGVYWIAGGNDGVRKSFDGINWFTPVTSPNQLYSALAFSSNNTPYITVGFLSANTLVDSNLGVNFFNNALPGILTQTRNTLSFTSTFVSFNNALHIYSSIAISVPYPLTQYEMNTNNYASSFVLNGQVSRFNNILNTPQIKTGALFMATQVI